MRPLRITVQPGTKSNWIPVSRRSWGEIGFTVQPQLGAAGTYDVEFTESEGQFGDRATLSRVGTTLTVNLVNHGLDTTNGCFIVRTTNGDYDGFFEVQTVPSLDQFTVTVLASGDATVGFVSPVVQDDVTGFTAVTGKDSGNVFASIFALRLNCTNSTTAPHDFLVNQYD